MRLGQLARKLDIETSEIIKYLEKKNITVENHLNTKLEDETVTLVMDAFTPEEEPEPIVEEIVEQKIQETSIETPNRVVEEVPEVKEDITPAPVEAIEEVEPLTIKEKEAITVSELREKEANEAEKENEEQKIIELSREDKVPENIDVAVIRAPKVELQGIKVLGKIELPEKTKKEIKANSNESSEGDSTSTTDEPKESVNMPNDGKHPNKKKLKTKKIIIPDSDIKKEEELEKPKKAKEIKAEKRAKEKAVKKKNTAKRQEVTTERQKIREKRKKQREKQKEAPKKKQKSWLRQLWDAIK